MLRAKTKAGPAKGANDERRLDAASRHEAVLGDAVGDLVEADSEKVSEHDLDDRSVARQRKTERRADKPGFRDRRIAHARRAELLIETLACLERTAGFADILAHDQCLRIAPHLLPQRRGDRFPVADFPHRRFDWLKPSRIDFLARRHWTNILAMKSSFGEGHGASAARSAAALTAERASTVMRSASASVMRSAA